MTEIRYRGYGNKFKLACLALILGAAAVYASAGVRQCVVCGKFYPDNPYELTREVDSYLAKVPGVKKSSGSVVGIMVPHAGYVFSAQTAAYAYKMIGDDYDDVVILSTAHTMPSEGAALIKTVFKTPIGEVPVDEKIAGELLKQKELFIDMPSAHANEHAIEVQIPFLQRKLKKPFKIVPVALNVEDWGKAVSIGKAIAKALKGKKTLIVISTDLSHYPDAKTARAIDITALKAIEVMDPYYFWVTNRILLSRKEENLSCVACGEGAVMAGMAACMELGANNAYTLHYENSSASPAGDKDRVVGYGAVAFLREPKKENRDWFFPDRYKKELFGVARKAIESRLEGKEFSLELSTRPAFNLPAAVFVTITKHDDLRGCIGTTEPRATLLDSIAYFAQAAAFEDTRFQPVSKEEFPYLRLEISILSAPRPVKSYKDVMTEKHGVIISAQGKKGLFLPQVWEQISGKEKFLSELCSQKAGLPSDCWKDPKTEISVFTVYSFIENKR